MLGWKVTKSHIGNKLHLYLGERECCHGLGFLRSRLWDGISMQEAYWEVLLRTHWTHCEKGRKWSMIGQREELKVSQANEGLSQPHREFEDGRILQSYTGPGQEDRAFIPHLDQSMGLDGSVREVWCWEKQLSSAEAIPKRGWAER